MKGKSHAWIAAVLAIALVGAMVVGCQPTEGTNQNETEMKFTTIKEGVIQAGADTAYPPFESKQGDVTEGFDVDLGNAIAEKLGVKWEVASTAWDGIIPGLQAGKYDVIMSAMTITDERKQEMDPSNPYILSDQSIAVPKGSDIKDMDGLKGKKVGVQVDTTGQFTAEETLGKDYKDLKKYDDILLAFQDLKAGRIDAIVNDLPVSQWIVENNYKEDMELATVVKTDETYGIWVQKGNDDLRNAVNDALDEIVTDGTYAEIYAKWFGDNPDTEALRALWMGGSTEGGATEGSTDATDTMMEDGAAEEEHPEE